jgi:spermidine synthase
LREQSRRSYKIFTGVIIKIMSIFDEIKAPEVLFETESPHNGNIKVLKSGNTTRLMVNNVTQSVNWDSVQAQKSVFGRMTEMLKELEPEAKNILILGLGGGTMQHLISRVFPDVHITSVELDEEIIEIAKNYFNLAEIPNHTVIHEDACRVIIEPEKNGLVPQTIDVVIVDIFIGDKYPDLGSSGNFLAAVKRLLVPGGLAVFNRIYLEDHQDDVNSFIETAENFFSEVQSVTVAGKTNSDNIIIFGRA